MKDYVSVNAQVIRGNAIHGTKKPPIRVTTGKNGAPRYGHEVHLTQPCRLVYSPHEPILRCGARLVLEAPAHSVEVVR